MERETAKEVLHERFDDWLKSHLQTLYLLISQLHELFNTIITISVGIVGIVIPLLLTTNTLPHKNFLLVSAGLFVLETMTGIFWQFYALVQAKKNWPHELKKIYNSYRTSVSEIRKASDGFREIIEKNFESGPTSAYSISYFEIVFICLFALAMAVFLFSIYKNFF